MRLIIGLLACFPAFAQPSAVPPVFEVASVKPSVSSTPCRLVGGPGTSSPERLSVVNCSLMTLLTHAYAVFVYQLDAPSWIGTANFDINAKIPPGATLGEF